jgi:hypothetical protein
VRACGEPELVDLSSSGERGELDFRRGVGVRQTYC